MEGVSNSIMSANELLVLLGVIGVVGIIGGWLSEKIKVPDVVIYLILGMLAGPLFFNIINIKTFPVANELILNFGSAFVLYQGGREIKLKVLNQVKVTVGLLATLGVFISMVTVAVGVFFIFKIPISKCLLLGAIIASTDPASLIPIFNQVPIFNKLKQTIISESAFNDAAGAILVTSLISTILSGQVTLGKSLLQLVVMAVVGIGVGSIVSLIGESLSSEKNFGIFREFSPIISVLSVVFAYEITEGLKGSGYMAVFIAGLISGNKKQFGLWTPEESFVSGEHFRENISTLSRMAIFLVLGTQVEVHALLKYGLRAFGIVLILMFIARPLVVLTCTFPDRKAKWRKNEILFMMWVRETGVIPAALSGMVVSLKITNYEMISSVVFMTILITLLLQASTTKWVAKKLKVLE